MGILNNFRLCLGARLHTEQGACLWAAFLTAFFGLLRKANVACVTQGQHPDSARQDSYPADFRQPPARLAPVVRRQDLERRPDGSYMLTLPCTKTRQPGSGRRTTAKNSFAAHHQRAPRHSVGGSGNARTMPGAGAGHVRRPDPGPAAERAVVRLAGCPDRHLEAPHLCSPSDRDEGAIATVRRRPDPIRGPIVPARRRILWRTTQPDSQLCTSRRWGIGSVTHSRYTLRQTRASGRWRNSGSVLLFDDRCPPNCPLAAERPRRRRYTPPPPARGLRPRAERSNAYSLAQQPRTPSPSTQPRPAAAAINCPQRLRLRRSHSNG